MKEPFAPWQSFLAATELNASTAPEFVGRANAYVSSQYALDPLTHAAPETQIRASQRLRSRMLARLVRRRQSVRVFAEHAMRAQDVARVFAPFALRADGSRNYASAGGLYPMHIYAATLRCDNPWNAAALQYSPQAQALSRVNNIDDTDHVRTICSILPESNPHMVVFFVAALDDVLAKYGTRGARFAFLETGAMANMLGVHLAACGFHGYELGGTWERECTKLLNIHDTRATVLHGFACGVS